jgi:SecD/SecF fusion protein
MSRALPVVFLALVASALPGCGGSDRPSAVCNDRPAQVLVYAARDASGGPATATATADAARQLCDRGRTLHADGLYVHAAGAGRIEIGASGRLPASVSELIGGPRLLRFYDWEANLLPLDQKRSQPSLFDAARLASKQRPDRASGGSKYFLFGPAGASGRDPIAPADALAGGAAPAGVEVSTPPAGWFSSCRQIESAYSRPTNSAGAPARRGACAPNLARLARRGSGPPAGSIVVNVAPGLALVEDRPPPNQAALGGYWVIEDRPALSGLDIVRPRQQFDSVTHEPIVTFDFTPAGRSAFARATKAVAHRGAAQTVVAGADPTTRFQHFAITLDNRIVSLPTIDYRALPEGISGSTGAQIAGLGGIDATRALATLLGARPLPLRLALVGVR